MSKFKRHAQGGRFKAANFGDLGLRAFREQQERQIRGLKEQNQQDQAYSRQHLQQLEGNAAKEIQHNRELQSFYNKRDDLAIDNTQLRGKREVEALMGEAKEYEKQAKFWKDFSTTYSQQYIQAAGDIYDIATTAQSNRQMTAIDNSEEYKKYSQQASKLANLTDYEGVNTQIKAHSDFAKGKISEKELNDIVGHVSEISLRMNSKTKKALLQREADEYPHTLTELKAIASANEWEWNAKTASELMFLRNREILRAHGVDPSSQAGRDFLKNVRRHEFNETDKLTKIAVGNAQMQTGAEHNELSEKLVAPVHFHDGAADKALKKKGIITGTGDNFIAYNANLNTRINHKADTFSLNENGETVSPTHNKHYAFVEIMESDIMSGKFVSKEQAKNHTINQPVPGAKLKHHEDGKSITYSEKETWIGRYGNSEDSEGKTLEDKFEEAWAAYEKQESLKFKNKKLSDDAEAQIDIDRRAQLDPSHKDYLNLQDPKVIDELIKTHAGKEETINKLSNYRLFAPHNTKEDVVTAALTDLYNKGKLKQLSEYTQYLSEDMQKVWRSKVEQLAILDRNGYTGTQLTERAKELLTQILGEESTTPGKLRPYGPLIREIKADILNTFDEVYDGGGRTDQDYIEALTAKIDEKRQLGAAGTVIGKGVWRRTNAGEKTTKFFILEDEDDPNPTVTTEELNNTIKGNLQELDNIFDNMKDGQIQVNDGEGEVTRHLIPMDEIDGAIRDINTGGQIKTNKIVETLWKRQPLIDGKRKYTRADIWNKVFENLGLDIKMPQGSIEHGYWAISASPFKVTKNLSAANVETVGVTSGLVKDGVIDLNQPSKESIKVNEEREIRSNSFNTLWEFWRNMTPLYKITPN
jgi:hypothetical protein